MANGVDVNPTDTAIFCAEEDYFSRLADQGNTAYEYAYGYWIPGNAKDALLAIFLRGTVNEVMEALSPHG